MTEDAAALGSPARSLDQGLLDWAVARLGAGRSAVRVEGLREGGSPWRITVADGSAGLLRVVPDGARAGLDTEVSALEHAGRHGLPVPRVVATALDGADGVLAVLTTVVPGSSRIAGAPPSLDRFRALGALAARVAAVPSPEASAALPERTRPIGTVDFAALRRQAPVRPLLRAAEEILAELRLPERPQVFVHGDLWQGNTLWDGDRLTGVVDWDCAGAGPAGVDLGSLRCDAALTCGREAAEAVLAGYEETTGQPADDVAYWDVVAALSTPPTIGWFADTIRDQGRTDLDQPILLRRRDAFLRAALDRLG